MNNVKKINERKPAKIIDADPETDNVIEIDNIRVARETVEETVDRISTLPASLQFLTYKQVATIFQVKINTVRQWVSSGKIRRSIRDGRFARVPLSEVQRLIAQMEVDIEKELTK